MNLADAAVILLGHGSTAGPAALVNLRRHAGRLARAVDIGKVHVATLHGPGARPAEVIRTVRCSKIFIVPVTMCDGQTMRDVVAALGDVNATRLRFCPPVGLDPSLAQVIAERAAAAAYRLGSRPAETTLLLVAHGSSSNPASESTARRHAVVVQAMNLFANVAVAFLGQEPRLADTLGWLTGPVVVTGLFAGGGRHATDDVSQALAACGRNDIAYLGAIGIDAAIASVIANILRGMPPDRRIGAVAPRSKDDRRLDREKKTCRRSC